MQEGRGRRDELEEDVERRVGEENEEDGERNVEGTWLT